MMRRQAGELKIKKSVIPCLHYGALTLRAKKGDSGLTGALVELFSRYRPSKDYATDEVAA